MIPGKANRSLVRMDHIRDRQLMEETKRQESCKKASIAYLVTAYEVSPEPTETRTSSASPNAGRYSPLMPACQSDATPSPTCVLPSLTDKLRQFEMADGQMHEIAVNPLSSLPCEDSGPLLTRAPRAPRPAYDGEQKFFRGVPDECSSLTLIVMYARIVKNMGWPEVEKNFEEIFDRRTKGGLTSVYYRIRRDWGLPEVLKANATCPEAEKDVVNQRARLMTRDSLLKIGYL